jgi:hypothetical protein
VTVTINATADGLGVGSYADTVNFLNTSNGNGDTNRSVSLTVNATPGELVVFGEDGFRAAGYTGGPFSPDSMVFTLTNAGGSELNWSIGTDTGWIELSGTNGWLGAGTWTNVTVSLKSESAGFPAGVYTGTVGFTNLTTLVGGSTREVRLAVEALRVTLSREGAAGMFRVIFRGQPGQSYVIETSSDLSQWVELSTLLAGADGLVVYEDADASGLPVRFYRLRVMR